MITGLNDLKDILVNTTMEISKTKRPFRLHTKAKKSVAVCCLEILLLSHGDLSSGTLGWYWRASHSLHGFWWSSHRWCLLNSVFDFGATTDKQTRVSCWNRKRGQNTRKLFYCVIENDFRREVWRKLWLIMAFHSTLKLSEEALVLIKVEQLLSEAVFNYNLTHACF